jgi:hypothetical protein
MKINYIKSKLSKEPMVRDKWICYHNNGEPKGPFRVLYRLKKPQKALSALMVYSSLVSNEITSRQREKYLFSITSPPLTTLSKYRLRELSRVRKRPKPGQFDDLLSFMMSDKRVATYVEPEMDSSQVDYTNMNFDIDDGPVIKTSDRTFETLYSSASHPLFEDWMDHPCNEDIPDYFSVIQAQSAIHGYEPDDQEHVGVISHIQEPGFKLRTVAVPLPVFQLSLSRMGNSLYQALSEMEEDATFDQDRGIREIQSYMRTGGRVSALDLSSATDRFPLEVIMDTLNETDAFNKADLDLFGLVSTGPYKDSHTGDTIKYAVGQPMGLYPSFGAFAYTHHNVVKSVNPKFYRILGDDIVIDSDSIQDLKDVYKELGVKLSESKCMYSDHATEFAGRIITHDRVYVQPKIRSISDNSFLELARNIGPTSLGMLKPRQKKVLKLFSEVPKDLHPYGMNWNPKGKSYDQRVTESQPILDLYEKKMDRFCSTASKTLSDLKLQLLLQQKEFAVSLEVNRKTQIESFESKTLAFAGVTCAEFCDRPIGWHIPLSTRDSDPRGISTLQVIEKLYKPLLTVREPKLEKSRIKHSSKKSLSYER